MIKINITKLQMNLTTHKTETFYIYKTKIRAIIEISEVAKPTGFCTKKVTRMEVHFK